MSAELGADLRSIRKSRGLTLNALAEKLDCSVGWLSQVERGISVPGPVHISRIAGELDVPVSMLARPGAPDESGRIVRRNARRAIGERVPGLHEWLLSPDLTDDFEVIHSRFQPGTRRDEPQRRPTVEVACLVAGKLDIWLDDEKFTLSQGDTFRVRDQALRWANPYSRVAEAIWVISPPVY